MKTNRKDWALKAIRDSLDEYGKTTLPNHELARKAGLEERTFRRALRDLKAEKLVFSRGKGHARSLSLAKRPAVDRERTAILILTQIADATQQNGEFYKGQARLAEELGVGVKAVSDAIKLLRERNWATWEDKARRVQGELRSLRHYAVTVQGWSVLGRAVPLADGEEQLPPDPEDGISLAEDERSELLDVIREQSEAIDALERALEGRHAVEDGDGLLASTLDDLRVAADERDALREDRDRLFRELEAHQIAVADLVTARRALEHQLDVLRAQVENLQSGFLPELESLKVRNEDLEVWKEKASKDLERLGGTEAAFVRLAALVGVREFLARSWKDAAKAIAAKHGDPASFRNAEEEIHRGRASRPVGDLASDDGFLLPEY